MSTLVMVEKDGVACMAAETQRTVGCRMRSARYLGEPEKILRVGDAYVGTVGWTVSRAVLMSALNDERVFDEIDDELALFEVSRTLHHKLKDEYFLNAQPDSDDPYEPSRLTMSVMNRHGIFGLDWIRTAERYERFSATGSGADLAIGAMYVAYEGEASAEDVARIGVEAAIEFDLYSSGPITLKKLKLGG